MWHLGRDVPQDQLSGHKQTQWKNFGLSHLIGSITYNLDEHLSVDAASHDDVWVRRGEFEG